ncbi:MAG: hypothetical protein JWP17_2953, partial [Solirubrobacterales bacterium]|nr:hypothetical protein [Solirubrobacterales bacterium]
MRGIVQPLRFEQLRGYEAGARVDPRVIVAVRARKNAIRDTERLVNCDGRREIGISWPTSASRLAFPIPRTPGVSHSLVAPACSSVSIGTSVIA